MSRGGAHGARAATRGPWALVRRLPERLRERAFWTTQLLVLGITGLHLAIEAVTQGAAHELDGTFHHLPVLLYVVPIGYASLAYGLEGAALTGLWGTVLTTPNLLLWHSDELTWVTELVFMAAVVSMGVLMAVPVEAERRQRQRAEATSRRLGLLNHITTSTLAADLPTTLDEALRRLADVLELAEVRVDLDGGTTGPVARHVRSPGTPTGTEQSTTVALRASLPGGPPVEGRLSARFPAGRSPVTEEHELLVGVADHLAVAIASERLRARERDRARAYARDVLQAQERERGSIARDLHDESAQNLVVVARDLADLAAAPSWDGDALAGVRDLVAETLAGLRRFSHDLRPPVLEDLGLAPALASLADRIRGRGDVDVDMQVEGVARRLDDDTEIALFRIAQEALHNVVRHAGATTATVGLRFEEDAVTLTVTDDGRGFVVPAGDADVATDGSLGLTGMRERAALVGAGLTIVSEPGTGTRVTVQLPG